MNTLEEKIRSAFQETAGEIGQAPPLRLPAARLRQRSRQLPRPRQGRRRWAEWVSPLAAGLSVVAVVAGSLWLTKVVTGHGADHAPSAATRRGHGTIKLGPAPAAPDGVPAYNVALAPGPLAGASTHVVVRATTTGAVLATVAPPAPFHDFTSVTGAADDRTFVLGSEAAGATKFFLLRLHPGAGTASLAPLRISVAHRGGQVDGVAVSPDGSKLAVASYARRMNRLTVYSLATGSAVTWTGAGRAHIAADELGANPLSWTADSRALAFDVWNGSDIDVRLLGATGPGGDLWSSTKIKTFRDWPSGSVAGSAIISPDGSKIIAMSVSGGVRSAGRIQVNEFSARTGALAGVLESLHYKAGQITGWPNVLWSDPSGSTLIVSVTAPDAQPRNHGGLTAEAVGIATRGRFAPLPGIPDGQKPAW